MKNYTPPTYGMVNVERERRAKGEPSHSELTAEEELDPEAKKAEKPPLNKMAKTPANKADSADAKGK